MELSYCLNLPDAALGRSHSGTSSVPAVGGSNGAHIGNSSNDSVEVMVALDPLSLTQLRAHPSIVPTHTVFPYPPILLPARVIVVAQVSYFFWWMQ